MVDVALKMSSKRPEAAFHISILNSRSKTHKMFWRMRPLFHELFIEKYWKCLNYRVVCMLRFILATTTAMYAWVLLFQSSVNPNGYESTRIHEWVPLKPCIRPNLEYSNKQQQKNCVGLFSVWNINTDSFKKAKAFSVPLLQFWDYQIQKTVETMLAYFAA